MSINHVNAHRLKYHTKNIHWNRIKISYKIEHQKGIIFIKIKYLYNNILHVKDQIYY